MTYASHTSCKPVAFSVPLPPFHPLEPQASINIPQTAAAPFLKLTFSTPTLSSPFSFRLN
jgi:hypothetical protein